MIFQQTEMQIQLQKYKAALTNRTLAMFSGLCRLSGDRFNSLIHLLLIQLVLLYLKER